MPMLSHMVKKAHRLAVARKGTRADALQAGEFPPPGEQVCRSVRAENRG